MSMARILTAGSRSRQSGFTIVELMIAALILGLVVTAGFRFYARMHQAAMAQDTVSEIQFQGRNTLRDMRKTVRQAGYNLTGHPAYQIKTDTLAVYYSLTKTVDTVLYYMTEFNTTEYSKMVNQPTGKKLYKLMKKVNSGAASLFADYVNSFQAVAVDSKNLVITLTVQSERPDTKYTLNNGYRIYTQGERVMMRNVT